MANANGLPTKAISRYSGYKEFTPCRYLRIPGAPPRGHTVLVPQVGGRDKNFGRQSSLPTKSERRRKWAPVMDMAKLTKHQLSLIRTAGTSVNRLKQVLNGLEVYPTGVGCSFVPFTILSKAFNVHAGVLLLCKAGLSSEAVALSRIMVEMYIGLRWMTNRDENKRCEEFARHQRATTGHSSTGADWCQAPKKTGEKATREAFRRIIPWPKIQKWKSWIIFRRLPNPGMSFESTVMV